MATTCWANSLGDCCDIQSREHYVTKGLFEGTSLKLKGLPFCKLDEISVGLASAASKILCKTHNERLSILDDEAIRIFECLREIFVRQQTQKALAPQVWKVRTWKINGRLLERWFLKTVINLVQVQTEAMNWPNGSNRLPTPDVVEACFGLRPIVSPRGLHAAAAIGHTVNSHDYVSFAPIRDTLNQALAGGAFEFRGLRFVFAWTDRDLGPFIRHLGEVAPPFAGWRDASLLHPFGGMNFKVGSHRAQVVVVKWPQFKGSRQ
jgi:hypothetical protein